MTWPTHDKAISPYFTFIQDVISFKLSPLYLAVVTAGWQWVLPISLLLLRAVLTPTVVWHLSCRVTTRNLLHTLLGWRYPSKPGTALGMQRICTIGFREGAQDTVSNTKRCR